MNRLETILDRASESIGAGLPQLAAALVLLFLGLLIVRLLARGLRKALHAARLDDAADRAGVHDALERVGLDRSLSTIIARAVRVALSIVVVLAAVSVLGLGFLSQSINRGVLFLPSLLVALALLLAGVVIGTWVKGRVDRLAYQMDVPGPVGRLAELVVIALFAASAFAQIGVSTAILTMLVSIMLAGIAAALAIAFGLGGREVARAMSAGRIVRGSLEPGQTITVAGVRGEIVAIESSATVLQTAAGATVHIPNHLVMESVLEIHPGTGPAGQPGPPGQPPTV
jgi:small-conductance mechanosensitive channel